MLNESIKLQLPKGQQTENQKEAQTVSLLHQMQSLNRWSQRVDPSELLMSERSTDCTPLSDAKKNLKTAIDLNKKQIRKVCRNKEL
jgi:hypothetical protein